MGREEGIEGGGGRRLFDCLSCQRGDIGENPFDPRRLDEPDEQREDEGDEGGE